MKKLFLGVLLVGVMGVLSGCPPQTGETHAVMLLTGDSSGKTLVKALLGDKLNVDVNLIAEFDVTVTQISLDTDGGSTAVFNGSLEVNLLDLTGVSQVITDAQIAPGTYTKIRLSIENPRMYLKAAPDVAITDIQITANGRLFVSQTVEVPAGQVSLIVLDFGGIHLVQQGNGGYTLTPQLAVNISVTNAQVTATGTITSNDTTAKSLVLDLGDSDLTVKYGSAQIFLATDTTTPTGTAADLAVGTSVQVDGLMQADGTVVADKVTIQPPAM